MLTLTSMFLLPGNREEILEKLELRRKCLGFESRWDGFSISENKHNIRTVPRSKLFVSARTFREQNQNSKKKTVLGWSPVDFCSSETEDDARKSPRPKFLVSGWWLQEQIPEPEEVSWFRVSQTFLVLWTLMVVEERRCYGEDITKQ